MAVENAGTGDVDEPDVDLWRDAVDIANIPTLLMVLVQLTGDERWLEDPYRPTRTRGLDDNDSGGLPDDIQGEIRDAAFAAIERWRRGASPAITEPSDDLLVRMLSVSLGTVVPTEYISMIRHGLHLDDSPPTPLSVPNGFSVLVIGAGVSGLCAAVNLQSAGIPYTIVERNSSVGGTWLENRYPGCGVDTPSYLYSFSFFQADWTQYFSLRDELRAYLERLAAEFHITPRIQFETEVISATYDEPTQSWDVALRRSDGSMEMHRANVVISAVGAFNKPKTPPIVGADSFAGPSVHTARWPEGGVELAGKRVAVIGTGASAMQLVPAVADDAQSITVFQRSPTWAAPFEKFKTSVPLPIRHLLAELPLYHDWYRLRLTWAYNDEVHPSLQKDHEWPYPERAINATNDRHREFFTQYIVSELGDRQDLLPKLLPDYPPYGKRMLMDNGWFRTMTRDDVHLVTDAIVEIVPAGVVTADGHLHEADVLVWATGFDVVRFLAPMELVGRNGTTLEDRWGHDDARAYLGTVIPEMPNFFCLYGPNAQFGHGGSLITIMERQMHYVMSVLQQMLVDGIGAVEVLEAVHDDYNERVDAAHEKMVWTHPGMDTYYRNSRGRVVVINPFRVVDFWRMTKRADLSQFCAEPGVDIAVGC